MVIYGVSFDMVGKQPIVLLKTVENNKFLPIWIGHPEAAAILMKLQGASTPRPMTHDLLSDVLGQLDVEWPRPAPASGPAPPRPAAPRPGEQPRPAAPRPAPPRPAGPAATRRAATRRGESPRPDPPRPGEQPRPSRTPSFLPFATAARGEC